MQEYLALGGPKQTRFRSSLLTESKGRGTSGGATRKEFVSVRPTPGSRQTNVLKIAAKVPKRLPGLYKEKVGTKVSGYRQVGSEGQVDRCGGVSPGVLAGSGQPLWLERVVSVPRGDAFLQGLLPS